MLRNLLIFLLLAGAAQAQSDFRCAVSPSDYSRTLFGEKRTAKAVRVWTCAVRNQGAEALVVTEGEMVRGLMAAGVPAYSAVSVRLMFIENQRLGRWKTLARIAGYAARAFTLVAAADFVNMGEDLRLGLVLGSQSLPVLGKAISNRAPSLESFASVAWNSPLGVERGSSASFLMFSAPWDGEPIVAGVLRGAGLPSMPRNPAVFPAPLPTRLRFELWSESSGGL